MEYVDRPVTVAVPARPPAAAIADCPPGDALPAAGPLTTAAVVTRLTAVEAALAVCRARLDALRRPAAP